MKNIPFSPSDIGVDEKKAILKVLESNWLSQGVETENFEKELANYIGCKNVIVVNNGTSALIAALLAHNISKGDEVLVPSFTFIATINSVLAVGAKPILIDIDPYTWNITVENAKKKLSNKTRAIIPVDVAGMPVDLNSFKDFCEKYNIILIEDAAEAIGAEYKYSKVGSFNHTSVFSFHMAKLISTIEGGCILTNDDYVAESCRQIRNHGMKGKYNYVSYGLNFRTTDLQSAMGRAQLKKIDKYIKIRNEISAIYKEELGEIGKFQKIPKYVTKHPYMIFGILVEEKKRDIFTHKLNNHGIDTRMWPSISKSPYHSKIFEEKFENSDKVALQLINLPIGNGLSKDETLYVCEYFKQIVKEDD